jgi:hypothetical protein
MRRVVLHLERVVLRGFAPEARRGFAAGLREALTRSLSGTNLGRDSNPHSAGGAVARAIARRMVR